MTFFGLTFSEWFVVVSAFFTMLWAGFKLKSNQDRLNDTVEEIQRAALIKEEKHNMLMKDVRIDFDRKIDLLETELQRQANHYASLAATLAAMQSNLQSLTNLINGTNARLDTLILRTKE